MLKVHKCLMKSRLESLSFGYFLPLLFSPLSGAPCAYAGTRGWRWANNETRINDSVSDKAIWHDLETYLATKTHAICPPSTTTGDEEERRNEGNPFSSPHPTEQSQVALYRFLVESHVVWRSLEGLGLPMVSGKQDLFDLHRIKPTC